MLGKAVRSRYCPATVSAPASKPVVSGCRRKQDFSQGCFVRIKTDLKPLETSRIARFWEGG